MSPGASLQSECSTPSLRWLSPVRLGKRHLHTVRGAYVTLLSRDSYAAGVKVLARSLHLAGSAFPFVCMHTAAVSQSVVEALAKEKVEMLLVEPLLPNDENSGKYKRALYADCWTKLQMWQMVQYDRIVYLDADMAVKANLDELFDLPQGFYAVSDCTAGRVSKQEQDNCPFSGCSRYFNAGMLCLNPSQEVFQKFQNLLALGKIRTSGFAEQDFLNNYYKDSWQELPYIFNGQKRIKYHHPSVWCWEDVAVVHYVDAKPWDADNEEHAAFQEMVEYWWDVHDGQALPSMQAQLACSKACAAITDAHGSSYDASMASTCVQDETDTSTPTKLGTEHMLQMLLANDEASSGHMASQQVATAQLHHVLDR
ncbi:glycosyltransferase 8 [Trebouxia sp. C0009 RCD-2024]